MVRRTYEKITNQLSAKWTEPTVNEKINGFRDILLGKRAEGDPTDVADSQYAAAYFIVHQTLKRDRPTFNNMPDFEV